MPEKLFNLTLTMFQRARKGKRLLSFVVVFGMYLIIFYSLCFGQIQESNPFPQNITFQITKNFNMKQELLFDPSANLSILYQPNMNDLIFQTNNENSSKIPQWKRTGIYTLEFLGAFVGSAYCGYVTGVCIVTTGEIKECIPWYILSNVVITSTSCWVTGKLLKENGSWKKTAIGAGAGSIIGSVFTINSFGKSGREESIAVVIGFTAPSLGAVIAFNL